MRILKPGDVVVMANLVMHKVGAILMYLPPYSPDDLPIKSRWSKLKTCLRATKSCTRQTLDGARAKAINLATAFDVREWFTQCSLSPI